MPRNIKTIAFVIALVLGIYFILTGSFIIGLILIGLAFVIPAA